MNCLFVHLFLGLLIQISNYHVSSGYINANLRDYLCADKLYLTFERVILGNLAIKLTNGRSSAAIVQQVWNTTSTIFPATNKIRSHCEFRVKTIQNKTRQQGIYARITISRFRRHPETKECLDYVQFVPDKYISTAKHCNNASLDDDSSYKTVLIYQSKGELKIRVHIDTLYTIAQPIKFHAVFTAHSECRYSSDILCDAYDLNSCISGSFLCDNITNCALTNRDENSCSSNAKPTLEMDSTHVILSAAVSFVLTMLGVIFCLWICCKFLNCAIGRQQEHETSISANRIDNQSNYADQNVIPVVELLSSPNVMLNSVNTDAHPSQQNLEEQTLKDLPPSYESLFPDRTPT